MKLGAAGLRRCVKVRAGVLDPITPTTDGRRRISSLSRITSSASAKVVLSAEGEPCSDGLLDGFLEVQGSPPSWDQSRFECDLPQIGPLSVEGLGSSVEEIDGGRGLVESLSAGVLPVGFPNSPRWREAMPPVPADSSVPGPAEFRLNMLHPPLPDRLILRLPCKVLPSSF